MSSPKRPLLRTGFPPAKKRKVRPSPLLAATQQRSRPKPHQLTEGLAQSSMDGSQEDDRLEEYFGEAYARWVLAEISPERTEKQVEFLLPHLPPPARGPLLDVGCGLGRHALSLASRGWSVVGLDRSPNFVAQAQREAERQGLSCHFQVGDMRTLSFEQEFTAVTFFWSSFGFLFRPGKSIHVGRRTSGIDARRLIVLGPGKPGSDPAPLSKGNLAGSRGPLDPGAQSLRCGHGNADHAQGLFGRGPAPRNGATVGSFTARPNCCGC